MNLLEEIVQYFAAIIFGIFVGAVVNAISRYFLSRSSTTLQSLPTSEFLRALIPVTSFRATYSIFRRDPNSTDTKPHSYSDVLVEIGCGIGVLALFVKFHPTPTFFANVAFCAALSAIFRIDLEGMIIPDAISLSGVWGGFMLSWFGAISSMDWKASLYGILFGAAILYVPAYLYRLIKGSDGLGGGDVKLMAMVGAFTGVQGVIFTLFVASLSGCLVGVIGFLYKRISSNSLIPFGPFISCAAILYIFFGQTIICLFLSISDYF